MDTPSISLVIPTYNRAGLLNEALQSVRGAVPPASDPVEVIVVDNNSSDGTAAVIAAMAADFPFTLRSVREPRQGLSYARNRGIDAARGDYVVFMDDDEKMDEHYLARIGEAFRETRAVCLGGPIHYYNAGGIPRWLAMLSENTGQFFDGDEIKVLTGEGKKLHGGNMAFRRDELIAAGSFRVELGRSGDQLLSGEDYEIQDRLQARGQKVVYHPRLIQYHYLRPERLHKGYWRRLHFAYGRTVYRYKQSVEGKAGISWFGAPRWMWRSLLTRDIPGFIHPASLLDSSRRLRRELAIWSRLGQMYEARRGGPAPGDAP